MTPEQIKTFRISEPRKWSQAELGKRLGVDQATISRAENGSSPLPKSAELLLEMLMGQAEPATESAA